MSLRLNRVEPAPLDGNDIRPPSGFETPPSTSAPVFQIPLPPTIVIDPGKIPTTGNIARYGNQTWKKGDRRTLRFAVPKNLRKWYKTPHDANVNAHMIRILRVDYIGDEMVVDIQVL